MTFPLTKDTARRTLIPAISLRKGDKIDFPVDTHDGVMHITPIVKRVIVHPSKPDVVRVVAIEPEFKTFPKIVCKTDFEHDCMVSLIIDQDD